MKKLIFGVIALLFAVSAMAIGGILTFSQNEIRFGNGAGVRLITFDESPDGNSAKISVDPANEEFVFNNKANTSNLDVDGKLEVSSTTDASRPYPVMTQAQRDALTPANGEIIYNSDVSSLEIYNSTSSIWTPLGGGGGEAGINFVEDASFEKEQLSLTASPGGQLLSYEDYSADDELIGEFNKKYFRASALALSSADYSVSYSLSRTSLDRKQGLFRVFLRTTTADLEVGVVVDGAEPGEELKITVKNDGEWNKYEIPFVFGSSTIGFKVFNASISGNIDLDVDKVYIGTMPDGYIQSVNNVDTDWISYTPTIVGVGSPTISFARYKRVGDSIAIEAKFTTGTPTATEFQFPLPSGLTVDSSVASITIKGTSFPDALTSGNFEFTLLATGGDSFLNAGISSTGRSPHDAANANNLYAAGVDISINSTLIPIAEWTTGRTEITNQRAELCNVIASGNDGDTITAGTEDVPFKTIESDDCNLWSNAGNTGANTNDAYTARKDGFILITGGMFISNADNSVRIYENGVTLGIDCSARVTSNRTNFSCLVPVIKDRYYTVRLNNNNANLTNSSSHRISIIEYPTDFNLEGKFSSASILDGVSSPSSGLGKARVCSFKANSCSALDEVGDCILSSSGGATGVCTFNFNSQYWSQAPNCTVTYRGANAGSTGGCRLINNEATGSIQTRCELWGGGGTLFNGSFAVSCHGVN